MATATGISSESKIALVKPELLSPAGNRECMVAAVENGADAVYFGLQGHNARARASNFAIEDLAEAMSYLHHRGVKGYVTLNTLAFPRELRGLAEIVGKVAEHGVDAVIVQDVGLARLIRAIAPELDIHASTQMSITSAEGSRLAKDLGCTRIILARELSLREIARVRAESTLPVEVFVHGALCVAYSGQCLTSEALGGRSANRGECAQACRMPYEIVCDGEVQDLGKTKFLLSPQDLSAHDLVPRLVELGVASLKIEGRLKAPEYVANITRHYREAIDQAVQGNRTSINLDAVREMELSFSRGFSHGFLDGNNHKVLVRGDYAKKRGVYVGEITAIANRRVHVQLNAPVKPGDGLVFDGDEDNAVREQGGRIYEVYSGQTSGLKSPRSPMPLSTGLISGPAELGFGRHDVDLQQLQVGQRIWKTDDPDLTRRLRKTFEGSPHRLSQLDVEVSARVGEPLRIRCVAASGAHAEIQADEPLSPATHRPATAEDLRSQFDRLGGTIYELGQFTATIEGSPLVPRSQMNDLRRKLVETLTGQSLIPTRTIADATVLDSLRPAVPESTPSSPRLSALCRNVDQIRAALSCGIETIYSEFQDIKQYGSAVAAVRESTGTAIYLATTRIQKPGEANLFRFLEKQGADGFLVRNPAGVFYCSDRNIPFVVDFSLNAANELAVDYFKSCGAERVAASYDLSFEQLDDLSKVVPPAWLEVVIHQQIPMFHMEHCVFCAFLSPGTDATNCGRPCDVHDVKLKDRVGVDHPLKADVGCRNTLYNAVPQTAAEYLPQLIRRGVQHLRVEFLDDDPSAVIKVLRLYQEAIAGTRHPKNLWRELKASNQYGVTRGQLSVLA